MKKRYIIYLHCWNTECNACLFSFSEYILNAIYTNVIICLYANISPRVKQFTVVSKTSPVFIFICSNYFVHSHFKKNSIWKYLGRLITMIKKRMFFISWYHICLCHYTIQTSVFWDSTYKSRCHLFPWWSLPRNTPDVYPVLF